MVAERALTAWLTGFGGGAVGLGLYQGHAGFVAGLNVAKARWPRLSGLAGRAAGSLAARLSGRRWPPAAVGWEDYDLILGPAGAVLALTTDPEVSPELVWPGARLLAGACDRADLDGLRVQIMRVGSEPNHWNVGRVNTGIGHGVAGVAAALRAACEVPGAPDECRHALGRVVRWLTDELYQDSWGVLTWPHAGLDGGEPSTTPSRRQAWCYGTPGASWALWEAGRVLGDAGTQDLAVEAMSSFCAAFDEDRYLYDTEPGDLDSLAFCHGAAGILLVADAFARHADLSMAADLRDRLDGYLSARLDQLPVMAQRWIRLLNGATGVLAALLTVRGADRAWLTQYGLR